MITRLNIRHITRHAHKAISRRLSYPAPYAVLAVERDGPAVIVRVNSGGNAIAVADRLNRHGYQAEHAGGNPGGYGCAVRVTCAQPARNNGTENADGRH